MAKVIKKAKKKTHVDANGVAHIKATFNNVIVTITGRQPAKMALKEAGRTHLLLHRFLLRLQRKRLMI